MLNKKEKEKYEEIIKLLREITNELKKFNDRREAKDGKEKNSH